MSARRRGQQDPAQGQECTAEAGVGNRALSKKTRDQRCARNISLCAQLLSAHLIPCRRENNWERGRRGESRNSPLDFPKDFPPCWCSNTKEIEMQFCRHHFWWQHFIGPVRLRSLCCAGAALCAVVLSNRPGNCFKKAAPSPPQLFLPWLSSQTQFTLSPLRCNWRKSAGAGKCGQKQGNRGLSKSTVPLKNARGPTPWGEFPFSNHGQLVCQN